MPETSNKSWQCPHCRLPLRKQQQQWLCAQNHSFDCARQGYVNLLPSHKKHSKQPGDNAEMVQARSRFLDAGFYLPLRQQLCTISKQYLTDAKGAWLDAGCGEGWYTSAIAQSIAQLTAFAFDISKPAINACCKRNSSINDTGFVSTDMNNTAMDSTVRASSTALDSKSTDDELVSNGSVEWAVASVADIPLLENSQTMILSIFSRIDWPEFARVLQDNGIVISVSPGSDHLIELRQAIYNDVRPYQVDKTLNELPDYIEPIELQRCHFEIKLKSPSEIHDLLAMTPHYWNISPQQREQLSERMHLTTRVDFRIQIFRHKPSFPTSGIWKNLSNKGNVSK